VTNNRKRVLSFGAGRMAPGLIEHLQRQSCDVSVADIKADEVDRLVLRFGLSRESCFVASADDDLVDVFRNFDVVASLMPSRLHWKVARNCIGARVPLITPSYPDARMSALDDEAREAQVTLLNEMGLDPGIDHAKAVQIVDWVHWQGGRVVSLSSYCGGLPAPENSDNPLRFKLSWSPEVIVGVATKPAAYRDAGRTVEITEDAIFSEPKEIWIDGFDEPFEGFPNRNSIPYISHYGLGDDTPETFIRGTLRYPGWSAFWRGLRNLGWPRDYLPGDLDVASRRLGISRDDSRFQPFEVLGAPLKRPYDDPVEQLVGLLDATPALHFSPGERDMVVMVIQCDYQLPGGEHRRKQSILQLYGEPERTHDPSDPADHGNVRALARTTGATMSIGTEALASGSLYSPGLMPGPVDPRFADLLCERLADEGIAFEDSDRQLA